MCVRETERGEEHGERDERRKGRWNERERQLTEECRSEREREREERERDEAVCLCLNACHPFFIQSHLHGSGEEKIT